MADDVTPLHPDQEAEPEYPQARAAGEKAGETTKWALLRLVFGPWMIMFVLGLAHHEVHTNWPALGFIHSAVVAIVLTVVAWFFRR